MGRPKRREVAGRTLTLDGARPPAAGEPWRAIVAQAAVDEHVAHRLGAAARFPAADTEQSPPVDYSPTRSGWRFTAGAREVSPVKAVDVADPWLAGFDEALGPDWPGARAWASRSALKGLA